MRKLFLRDPACERCHGTGTVRGAEDATDEVCEDCGEWCDITSTGWIGVDLDGTLSKYEGNLAPTEIGKPIQVTVDRVRGWIKNKQEVKIFTARIAETRVTPTTIERQLRHAADYGEVLSVDAATMLIEMWNSQRSAIRRAINRWCQRNIGTTLEITNEKDFAMIQLWDDRAVRVTFNTGERCCGEG